MRTNLGRIGGLIATLGALLVTQTITPSNEADAASKLLAFSAPAEITSQPDRDTVSLASCCSTVAGDGAPGESASCCETSGVCETGCSSFGTLDGGGYATGFLDHLSSLIAPSDRCYDGFVSPMTNPFYFEDPRTLTEARIIYARNKVPLAAAGGTIDVFAIQLRAALTERLSVIATKNGFLASDNPVVNDGWLDVNFGLKYNLIRDPQRQWLYSIGATYETTSGTSRALQGNGDGTFHLFSSCAKRYYGWNVIMGHGWVIPTDDAAESEWFYYSSHASHRLGGSNFFAVAELNWYHWLESGTNGFPGVEGLDLFNLGSTGVAGNDITMGALGVKYKPRRDLELGVAWENPLSGRRDILDNRLTLDCILRY